MLSRGGDVLEHRKHNVGLLQETVAEPMTVISLRFCASSSHFLEVRGIACVRLGLAV